MTRFGYFPPVGKSQSQLATVKRPQSPSPLAALTSSSPRFRVSVIRFGNGVHAASGGQALTNADLDFADLGRAVDLKHAENIGSVNAFQSALVSALEGDGPSLLALATEPDLDAAMAPVMLDPVATKRRFMEAVGAPRYVSIFFGGGNLVEP